MWHCIYNRETGELCAVTRLLLAFDDTQYGSCPFGNDLPDPSEVVWSPAMRGFTGKHSCPRTPPQLVPPHAKFELPPPEVIEKIVEVERIVPQIEYVDRVEYVDREVPVDRVVEVEKRVEVPVYLERTQDDLLASLMPSEPKPRRKFKWKFWERGEK